MTVTVLDSTDLPGILAEAGVTLDQPEKQPDESETQAPVETAAAHEDPDDVEGDDGLTPRQKREMTATMQKTIGKKHRMQKEAEEFAAAQFNEKQLALQRAEKLERELAEIKARLEPKQDSRTAPAEPQRENFANEAAYVDAMIQFHVDKRLAEKAAEDQANAEKRRLEERLETAAARIRHAVELQPDFVEVVGAVDTVLPAAIATYLEESDMVAELSYHLAKNPELLDSISKLSPHAQLVKIGKIESTLTPFGQSQAQHDTSSSQAASDGKAFKAAPSKDTDIDLSKPRSKAAPVITPLDASGSAGNSKDSKDMNIRESIEEFAKRNRVNLGARKRH
jgi:hypothetical protein